MARFLFWVSSCRATLRRQEPFHRECFYVTGTRLSYLHKRLLLSSSWTNGMVFSVSLPRDHSIHLLLLPPSLFLARAKERERRRGEEFQRPVTLRKGRETRPVHTFAIIWKLSLILAKVWRVFLFLHDQVINQLSFQGLVVRGMLLLWNFHQPGNS